MRQFAIGILVALLYVSTPTDKATACSCLSKPTKIAFAESGAVFSGVVIGVVDTNFIKIAMKDELLIRPIELRFRIVVLKLWKGTIPDTVIVRTRASVAGCGFPFVMGKSFLVYAVQVGDWVTGACSRTKDLSIASLDVQELDEIIKSQKH